MESNNEEKRGSNEDIEDIIKTHVIFGMTAGAIPVPIVDFVAISAIQLDMLKQITESFGVDYDINQGKSLASSLIGTSLAKIGASLVKAIPGVGTIAGVASQVILAGASTYALGKVFEAHFSNNGTLFDFDTSSMRKKYDEFLGKGKEFAKNMKKDSSKEDVFETIEKLKQLKESGAISEEDFEATKKQLLERIAKEG
ncbi:MAG: DUF697 domain-containing protein [bacterium]|nr:DUF697 domain-containing protein [bacterium]